MLICGSDSTHRPRCAHTRSENTPRKVAQLRAASRIAACKAVSSALRNRDRSLSVRGAGPRVFVPSSRRCRAISRPASALPIFASVHCLPIGETPRAPFLRQRAASGISEVTHTSAAEMCSAIQSSAASALSPTRTITHVRGAERPDRSRAVKDDQNIEAQARRHAVDLLPGMHHHRRRFQSTSGSLPQHISHSRSFDHRLRARAPFTAMASAFRCPTRTTRRFPRVTPV